MRRLFLVVLVAGLISGLALVGSPVMARSCAGWFGIWHANGAESSVFLYSDHTSDTLLVLEPNYLLIVSGAVEGDGMKYSSYGPNAVGDWKVWIWCGNQMTDGMPYEVTFYALEGCQISGQRWDGTAVESVILAAGEDYSWSLETLHATTSQWRTRGNMFLVSPVPEPSGVVALVSGLLGMASWYRRRR